MFHRAYQRTVHVARIVQLVARRDRAFSTSFWHRVDAYRRRRTVCDEARPHLHRARRAHHI